MRYAEGTNTTADNIHSITTPRLTVKDNTDRVNYFDNATVEVTYIMGDKFYKVSHDKGVDYYNPANVVFLRF